MSCEHGRRPGSYCGDCARVIRPSRSELKWSHYSQAPREHRESGRCELCNACRQELYGAGEQLTLGDAQELVPRQAPEREAIATGRSFPCLSCNLRGACYGAIKGCRNYSGPNL